MRGYEEIVDFISWEGGGGHRRSSLFLGVISMYFRVLGYRMGTFLGVGKISNIFLSIPDIHDTFYWVGDG